MLIPLPRPLRVLALALLSCILVLPCLAANNRPLIYGMNPTPMDWWGYDKNTHDPLLFQKMRQGGCTSARVGVGWDNVEPVKGTRDWSEADRWINLCLDNNIEPVLLINSTAPWALPSNCDTSIPAYPARYPPGEEYIADFQDYVYDLVRRFRGRVRYYEFWNEANGYGWYTALTNPPSYSRADQYTPWMIRCYKALKLADPTAMMSTTGIDDGGDGHAAYYLNLIYQHGGKGYFDAVADHPYPAGGDFQAWKLDRIREVLDSHGDQHVKVWITEFGYDWSSFTSQVSYYFDQLTQDKYDYVRIATWHTANEFPWEAGFGLLDRYLNAKPEYNTFKNYPKPARPTVGAPTVTHLSPTSVRISFTTNVASTCLVMHGPTVNYGSMTIRETVPSTSHQIELRGLAPGTTHHYRVRAGAVEDGDAFSVDRVFTTQTGPAVSIVSGPTVSEVTATSAVVSWTTDVPATGSVEYGAGFAYGAIALQPDLSTIHSVRLSGLQPGSNYQFRVQSHAAGYASALKEGDAFRTEEIAGTLVNGGFEDGFSGWTYWEVYPWGNAGGDGIVDYPGHMGYGIDGGTRTPMPSCVEGYHRATGEAGWASCVGGYYQTIDTTNGPHIVSGWIAASFDGGGELAEIVAFDGPYTGGIPSGTTIGSLTETSGWTRFTGVVDVTTGKLTVAVRAGQFWALDIVTAHFDGISAVAAVRGSIASLKAAGVGDGVVTEVGRTVSAVVDPYTFYAQDQDRTSGIRVVSAAPHGLSVGDGVSVCGTLALVSGEARIESAVVLFRTSTTEPKPLAVRLDALGGAASGVQPAVGTARGASNTGLLVKTWGEVTNVSLTGFVIADGSGASARCALPGANAVVSVGDIVACTGVSSCELIGDDAAPVLILRGPGDLSKFRP